MIQKDPWKRGHLPQSLGAEGHLAEFAAGPSHPDAHGPSFFEAPEAKKKAYICDKPTTLLDVTK